MLSSPYTPKATRSPNVLTSPWEGAAGSGTRLSIFRKPSAGSPMRGGATPETPLGGDSDGSRRTIRRASLVDTSRKGDVRYSAMDRVAMALEIKGVHAASVFRKLDTDKSGYLGWKEFIMALRDLNCGLTEDEELEVCQKVDDDGNGSISYNEFVHGLGLRGGYSTVNNTYRPSSPSNKEKYGLKPGVDLIMEKIAAKCSGKSKKIANIFRRFDKDCDGKLTVDEFRQGLEDIGAPLTDDDFEHLVDQLDSEGTGTIMYKDFAFRLGAAPVSGVSFRPTSPIDPSKYRFTVTHGKHTLLGQIAQKVESQSSNVRKVFRQLDRNGNGRLEPAELRIGLRHLGFDLTNEQFDEVFGVLDVDHNEMISYQEFLSRITSTMEQGNYRYEPSARTDDAAKRYGLTMLRKDDLLWRVATKVEAKSKHLTAVFRSFDTDHDGEIDYAEFRAGLAKLDVFVTDEEFYHLIKRIDVDGDGFITYKEFANKMGATHLGAGEEEEEMSDKLMSEEAAAFKRNLKKQQAVAKERQQRGTLDSLPRSDILRRLEDTCRSKMKNLRRTLRGHDTDADGRLTLEELKWALREIGLDFTGEPLFDLFVRFAEEEDTMNYHALADMIQPELPSPGSARNRNARERHHSLEETRKIATPGKPLNMSKAAIESDADLEEGVSTQVTKCDVLYSVAMHVISRKINAAGVLRAFRTFDTRGSGFLNAQQIQSAIHELGLHLPFRNVELLVRRFSGEEANGLVDYRRLAAALQWT